MNKHPSSAYRMQGDSYSRSLPRDMHRSMERNMEPDGRSMYNNKPQDTTSGDQSDMDSARHGPPSSMYGGTYGTLPRGMHPAMYGGMPGGFGQPRSMEYPTDVPRRFGDRHERPMEMPYGRFMDMFQGRYMSSHDRLMNMMQNRHFYGQPPMNRGRAGQSIYGSMEPRGRHMDHYE